MQSVAFVALLCCVLAVSGAPAESEQIQAKCLEKFPVSADFLAKLQVPAEVVKIQADETIKCFSKCVQEGFGLIKDNVIQVDQVIAVNTAQGRPEATVRTNLERCSPMFTGSNTCEEAWLMYQCVSADK